MCEEEKMGWGGGEAEANKQRNVCNIPLYE